MFSEMSLVSRCTGGGSGVGGNEALKGEGRREGQIIYVNGQNKSWQL